MSNNLRICLVSLGILAVLLCSSAITSHAFEMTSATTPSSTASSSASSASSAKVSFNSFKGLTSAKTSTPLLSLPPTQPTSSSGKPLTYTGHGVGVGGNYSSPGTSSTNSPSTPVSFFPPKANGGSPNPSKTNGVKPISDTRLNSQASLLSYGSTQPNNPCSPTSSNCSSPGSSAPVGYQNPGDGYCGAGTCSDLTYHGGSVLHNTEFIIDVWVACGSSGCYNSCSGQTYFDGPGIGGTDDCAYIYQQEQYFQDFCTNNGLFAVINQYTDGSGNPGGCFLAGGSASGGSVSYTYDYTSYPHYPLTDGDIQNSANNIAQYVGGCVSAYNTGPNCEVLVLTDYGWPSCYNSSNCFWPGTQLNYCAYHSSDTFFAPFPVLYGLAYASMPDVYWAGGSCGAGVPAPTGDPAADLEVSPLSHEADETITNPYGGGWFWNDGSHEIGDECAYDFVGTQPFDGSNVHLGPNLDLYEIQSEWSNYNGGCTFDLNGAPTLVSDYLLSDSSQAGYPAQAWSFPLYYVMAGEPYSYVYSSLSSSTVGYPAENTQIWVTPYYYFWTYPSTGSGWEFCFGQECDYQNWDITANYGTTTNLFYNYYEMFEQNPYMNIVDGGSPPYAPTFYYQTAPACGYGCEAVADGTVSGSPVTLPESSPGPSVFAVYGSTASVDTCIPITTVTYPFFFEYCGSPAGERWDTGGPCNLLLFSCSTSFTILGYTPYGINGINYYHQYDDTFSYSITGGGSPTAPTLSSTQFGSAYSTTLSTSATGNWLDSGASWSVLPNPLGGSTSTERWAASTPHVGTVTGSVATVVNYYHQFFVPVSFTVVGGAGYTTAPQINSMNFGHSVFKTLTATPTSYWFDAGATWAVNPTTLAGSGATQKWASISVHTGTITSASAISLTYYHQYYVPVSFSVSDGSTGYTANPQLAGKNFGNNVYKTLTTSPVKYWLDAGSTWTVNPQFLAGGSSTQRWVALGVRTGTVTSASPIKVVYTHQYYVTFKVTPTGHGTAPATGWYNANTPDAITATPGAGHSFVSWSATAGITFASSTSASTTMTVTASGTVTATFT